ncbi:MAG: ferritin family protein [Deltaproteobacteria bacterium]|nr:ferritin family protein [Deltaproteobacteria bacterium]
MFSLKDIIDIAVQIELNGEKIYRCAAEKIQNPSLSTLLQWLADEEVKHMEWFAALKDKIADTGEHPEQEKFGRALLQNAVGSHSLSLEDADFSDIEQVKDLIHLVMEFENDTVLFYKMLQPLIEDQETLDQLHTIIQEEEDHALRLKKVLSES